ncbi:MAG TPA: TIGR04282 family arsenosugar biosynthesis glycosyltransferase [Desulfobaccales bacterium]
MTTLLIIFAKEPVPGQVKTRLCPPLAPEAAACLYQSFLADILEEMGGLAGLHLALAYSPAGAQAFFHNLVPAGVSLFPQEGADLGERMARAFDRGFAAGFATVLLRGSDTPDLPGAVVRQAAEVLAAGLAQVVLGPSPDGGYYLVGLRSPQPELFRGPAWSGAAVLQDTLKLARRLSLAAHLLPPWPDIDNLDDLASFLARPHPAPGPGWRSHLLARQLVGGWTEAHQAAQQ